MVIIILVPLRGILILVQSRLPLKGSSSCSRSCRFLSRLLCFFLPLFFSTPTLAGIIAPPLPILPAQEHLAQRLEEIYLTLGWGAAQRNLIHTYRSPRRKRLR